MKKLILIGGGGHCKSCIDVIESENKYQICGILDVKEKIGKKVFGYEIIGTDEDIEKYAKEGCYFLISAGQIKTPEIRIKLYKKIKNSNGKFATIVSPRAHVSRYAKIEEGTIIMHDALVNAGSSIGRNCIINTKALIEHDCIIGDNCHIAVGAITAGGVIIGNNSFFGANSIIVQNVKIPENTFIKAGSLVKCPNKKSR